MRFIEIKEKEQKQLIKQSVNKLINGLNVDLSEDEVIFIFDSVYEWLGNSNAFTKVLDEIYDEIIENYKRYIPFCYASIRTAYKNIQNKKQ